VCLKLMVRLSTEAAARESFGLIQAASKEWLGLWIRSRFLLPALTGLLLILLRAYILGLVAINAKGPSCSSVCMCIAAGDAAALTSIRGGPPVFNAAKLVGVLWEAFASTSATWGWCLLCRGSL